MTLVVEPIFYIYFILQGSWESKEPSLRCLRLHGENFGDHNLSSRPFEATDASLLLYRGRLGAEGSRARGVARK